MACAPQCLARPSPAPSACACRRRRSAGISSTGPNRTVLAAEDDGSVAPAEDCDPGGRLAPEACRRRGIQALRPSLLRDALLRLGSDGSLALAARRTAGPRARFAFRRARRCAAYPEAPLDATGTPSRGTTPYGAVGGFLEGHMHWMTYEYFGGNFHCGRPWHPLRHPLRAARLLVDRGPAGHRRAAPELPQLRQPRRSRTTRRGWPKLTEWSADNLTYEGTYWRWIERAWLGGLRLMVMGVNENRVLCELQTNRETNCNEMDTVRRGLQGHARARSTTSTRRPAARARASSRSSPTRTRRGA